MIDKLDLLKGDSRFFWPENLKFLLHLPYAWDSSLNTGIGISDINTLWITTYLSLTSSFFNLGLSWFYIQVFFWILPIILTSFFSSFLLFKKLFNTKSVIFPIISGIIFTANTYFILIFTGGQFGVSFAYSLTPLVYLASFRLFKKKDFRASIIAGLIFSFQILLDPRIAILTIASLVLFYLIRWKFTKKDLLYLVLIPFGIVFLLHSFWIVPALVFRTNIIPAGFSSISGIRFLSFSFFENSLSLLHPNWPDNVFGKVYFMKPEFLLIPVIALASLFFVNKEDFQKKKIILFFCFLALLSAFLGKGANEPFGNIFIFMVEKIPGFSIFRDSTKFYFLIALSFSLLIPYSLFKASNIVKPKIILVIFIIFWVFTLRLFFSNSILKINRVPNSYIQLKDFLVSQNAFFRTLWIPEWQRYGYFSDINPAIGRHELLGGASSSAMIKDLEKLATKEKLQDLSVKYVVIPEDSEKEIFLKDRKYNENIHRDTLSRIERITYLKRIKSFGKITVFELPQIHDRFFSADDSLKVTYKFINPTKYIVNLENAKRGDTLVFSENFDKYWKAKDSQTKIPSTKFRNGLNSFILTKTGNYNLLVYYEPQKWVYIGLVVSGLTFVFALLFLLQRKKSN